ncbi:hypothetical protein AOY38_10870 [Synechocystis sp. PCC 6803]|uniref:type II toxin-antitoxin system RelE family toxin n=1 Tax=unclassified Synechocystis TaxID=2640012 RepID=UPI0002A59D4E|nr:MULTISPECIES: hypothetical protein [unclassified Synechocystis]BAM54606.1 hypothetical protein BEST7613_5675 [Synechocystis sp. PCC 6803] [Bacillus subtilis BEST7613]ALJ68290.1 hypothetical protein AOY38_10870 [Synechocystis sp. PCC 6803]AVP90131.1 hypothetical protein C7I86_10910 [Synechocystis sp. IPPAS B-1465]MCW5241573.1 hypothetical protein [Synechocystis sp. PCC 6803]QHV00527.1 hypothetical protein BWK47_10585 [Synechocystis sp. CACIAM 05]
MNHHTNSDFWFCYRHLPEEIQRRADKAYQLLNQNPRHPSLHFKKVGELWSVRVTLDYRALSVETDDGYVWFWIGTHEDYDKLLG